jgi:hypothetical protein
MVVMRTKYHYFVIEIILYMNQLKTLLVIGFVCPEPSAGGGRNDTIDIYLFKEEGYDVTFACPAMESVYMIDLEFECSEEVNIIK